MQKLLRFASLLLFALLCLFLVWFGWLYASVEEPLWFHIAAVPDHAKEAIRPLYFALMNLIGGSSLGLGLLALFVTLTAVRRGSVAAASMLVVALAIPFIMAAVTAEELSKTGAPTSWHIMGILMFVTVLAFAAHLLSRRK